MVFELKVIVSVLVNHEVKIDFFIALRWNNNCKSHGTYSMIVTVYEDCKQTDSFLTLKVT